jgi:DNA-binding IclR family transcriptional regulator
VTAARAAGYALTSGEVVPGLSSVAAPVVTADGRVVASVAVLFLQEPPRDVGPVALRVCRAAQAIARELP